MDRAETRRAREQLSSGLADLARARASVKTYWAECTADAKPLTDLDRQSHDDLMRMSDMLWRCALRRPQQRRKGLSNLLLHVEAAWRDSCSALEGWHGAVDALADGDAALMRVREAVTILA